MMTSYTKAICTPSNSRKIFLRLMIHIATKCLQFRFNNTMYQQIDGISMGSLLEAAQAIIFVGFYKERLLKITNTPLFYKRYVNDTFAIFSFKSESRCFFHTVNKLHPVLTFTYEFENNNSLPLLDILIEWTNLGIQISIHRKQAFAGS